MIKNAKELNAIAEEVQSKIEQSIKQAKLEKHKGRLDFIMGKCLDAAQQGKYSLEHDTYLLEDDIQELSNILLDYGYSVQRPSFLDKRKIIIGWKNK